MLDPHTRRRAGARRDRRARRRADRGPRRPDPGAAVIATYRLQLSPELDFAAVRALVPYLRDLGISHLYLSPVAAGAHGLDARLRRRRSRRGCPRRSAGRRGCARWPARACGSCWTSCPTTWASPTRTAGGPTSASARGSSTTTPTTAGTGASSTSTTWPACASRTPRSSSSSTARCSSSSRDGVVDGLRVDHPDGLADPAGYLRAPARRRRRHVWVEKILAHPASRCATGPSRARSATSSSTTPPRCSSTRRRRRRSRAAGRAPASRLRRGRGERAARAGDDDLRARGGAAARAAATIDGIAEALAALPVYRTYVEPWRGAWRTPTCARSRPPPTAPRRRAGAARARPRRVRHALPADLAAGHREGRRGHRLLPLPAAARAQRGRRRPGALRASRSTAFHAANAARAERFPRGLLVTQTHDTKRSGDVRARIGALSTMAERVGGAGRGAGCRERGRARRAQRATSSCRRSSAPGRSSPSAWTAYVEKALREAKLRTSWVDARRGLRGRGTRLRARSRRDARPTGFVAFAERVAVEGRRAALGQLLLKLTAPGVPDVYQGDELEALSLVDPDNRRPVDWEARRAALARLRAGEAPRDFGERKLDLIRRALALRARRPEAFAGAYEPVDAGPGVCAYLRGGEVLAVVPVRDWEGARLAVPGRWRSVLDDARAGGPDGRARASPSSPVHGRWRCSSAREQLGRGRGRRRAGCAGRRSRPSRRSSRRTGPQQSVARGRGQRLVQQADDAAREQSAGQARARGLQPRPARSAPKAQPRKAPAAIIPTAVLAVSVPSAEESVRPA